MKEYKWPINKQNFPTIHAPSAQVVPGLGGVVRLKGWDVAAKFSHYTFSIHTNLDLSSLSHWNFHLSRSHVLVKSYPAFLQYPIIIANPPITQYNKGRDTRIHTQRAEEIGIINPYALIILPLPESHIRRWYKDSIFEGSREDKWATF